MGQLGGVFQLTLRFQLELPFHRESEPAQGSADLAESAQGAASAMPLPREQGKRRRRRRQSNAAKSQENLAGHRTVRSLETRVLEGS